MHHHQEEAPQRSARGVGRVAKGKRTGRARRNIVSLVSFFEGWVIGAFVIAFVPTSLSFVWRINGDKETGEPY